MTRIELVIRQVSDLRDFYLRIQRLKKRYGAEKREKPLSGAECASSGLHRESPDAG